MSFAFLILLIVAVVGSVGLASLFGLLSRRMQRLEGSGPVDIHRLLADNEELRQQMSLLEAEVDRLSERVDFTEKLLEGPRPGRTSDPGSEADGGTGG